MIKISSWNVAGLRACCKKGCFEYFIQEAPDIQCFQETKCTESQLPVYLYDHSYWLASKKAGYCGVGLCSKTKPLSIQYGIGDVDLDEEARLITAEYEKFFLVNAYVPNSGEKLKTLQKRLKWDNLMREYLVDLDQVKPVIFCGDLNVAHNEIDLANPGKNTHNAGFTIEERTNFTDLLERGFTDTFRSLYPDKKAAYTYWSYFGNARSKNIGWRIDYFLVSNRINHAVKDCIIQDDVHGSDHCPVVLLIDENYL